MIFIPSEAIPHLIGTVCLLIIMLTVILISQMILVYVNNDTITTSLKETTIYVSYEVVELVSLAGSTGSSPLFIYKVLNNTIPSSLQNKGYTIKYAKDAVGWKVVAYLDEFHTISANSSLGWGSGIKVINSAMNIPCINTQLKMTGIQNMPSVNSGSFTSRHPIIIWCQRFTNGTISVGMGVMTS